MTELLNDFLTGSVAWGVLLTLAAFGLGVLINRVTGKAIFNPLLLGSIFVIVRDRKCPSPCTVASSAPVSTAAHSCAAADRVAEISLLNSRWVMWERPTANAAHSTARCAMLLLGGAAIAPPMPPGAGLMVTSIAVLSFCNFPRAALWAPPWGSWRASA